MNDETHPSNPYQPPLTRETLRTPLPDGSISWARYVVNIGCGAAALAVLSLYALVAGIYLLNEPGAFVAFVLVVLLMGGSVHAIVWASKRRPAIGLGERTERDRVLASMSLLDSRPHVTLKSHPR